MKLSFLFFLVICFVSCKNDIKEVESMTGQKGLPAEVSTGIEVIYSDSARVKARLEAPKMIRYISNENPTVVMPKGIRVEFFDKNKNVNSRLRADYGMRYLNTGLTKVAGNVEVVNIQGDTMNTEEMFWDEVHEKVYSSKFVKVRRKEEIILSEGFSSDLSFTNYKFYKIRGIVDVKH